MPSLKILKLQHATPVFVLALLMLAAGCRGFFVNPQLTSLTVTPSSITITKGSTQSLVATGNFNDGSTKNLTGNVSWTSSDTACATVSSTGVVTAANVSNSCSTTVTATTTGSSGALTATSSVSVQPGSLTAITITSSATTVAAGSTVTFTAMGTFSGSSQQQDITSSVQWNSSNTSILTISGSTGTVSSSATSGQTATVTATLNGITSNAVTITVQ